MGREKRDGRKKETFSFFHLPDYDKWPGLSLVCAPPALSLGLPPHKRLFQGERTPQILLFVPDSAQPTPQRCSFNHGEAGKARVRFNAQRAQAAYFVHLRRATALMRVMFVCVRASGGEGREREGKGRRLGDRRRGRSLCGD